MGEWVSGKSVLRTADRCQKTFYFYFIQSLIQVPMAKLGFAEKKEKQDQL